VRTGGRHSRIRKTARRRAKTRPDNGFRHAHWTRYDHQPSRLPSHHWR
jgi:hypothetical protein